MGTVAVTLMATMSRMPAAVNVSMGITLRPFLSPFAYYQPVVDPTAHRRHPGPRRPDDRAGNGTFAGAGVADLRKVIKQPVEENVFEVVGGQVFA